MSKRFISCFLLITIMLNFIFIGPSHAAGLDPDKRQQVGPYFDPVEEEGHEDKEILYPLLGTKYLYYAFHH